MLNFYIVILESKSTAYKVYWKIQWTFKVSKSIIIKVTFPLITLKIYPLHLSTLSSGSCLSWMSLVGPLCLPQCPELIQNVSSVVILTSRKSQKLQVPCLVNKVDEDTRWCSQRPAFPLDGAQQQQPSYSDYTIKTLTKEHFKTPAGSGKCGAISVFKPKGGIWGRG